MKTKRIFLVPFTVLSYALILFACIETMASSIKFAVIGDYGKLCEYTKKGSSLVESWSPDFIITTGDNNYPGGERETIDENIGSLYSTYIYPYNGKHKQPSIKYNRFFPCLGNHDFDTESAAP